MRRILLTGALMMMALSACAGQRALGGSPAISVVNETSLRAPDGSPAETADRTYRVGARDKLLVDVFGSEEHTSELQSLMRSSYAVFCLKKKKQSSKSRCKAKH